MFFIRRVHVVLAWNTSLLDKYTNRFVGNILDTADKMSVSAVLSGHVEWQGHVERRHRRQLLVLVRMVDSHAAGFFRTP